MDNEPNEPIEDKGQEITQNKEIPAPKKAEPEVPKNEDLPENKSDNPEIEPKPPENSNLYQLFEKHLGIKLESPPELIHYKNRFHTFFSKHGGILYNVAPGSHAGAEYDPKNNIIALGNTAKHDQATILHELAHTAQYQVDDELDANTTKDKDASNRAAKRLKKYKGDDNQHREYLRETFYLLSERAQVDRFISEGLSEFIAYEVLAREAGLEDIDDLINYHGLVITDKLEDLEDMQAGAFSELLNEPYVLGHKFVLEAMAALQIKYGLSIRDSLIWFMQHRPLFQHQIDDGGIKYVKRNYQAD